jgi:hypothetical protein
MRMRDDRKGGRRRASDRELDARCRTDANEGALTLVAHAQKRGRTRDDRCEQAAERDPVVAAR